MFKDARRSLARILPGLESPSALVTRLGGEFPLGAGCITGRHHRDFKVIAAAIAGEWLTNQCSSN